MLRMVVTVEVEATAPTHVENVATISGGGALEANTTEASEVGAVPAGFGIVPGSLFTALSTTQAGAHPNITTSFSFNQNEINGSIGSDRDLSFELPAGLVGNPTAVPRCSMDQVIASTCPNDTAIGVATVFSSEIGSTKANPDIVLVYNIVPERGEPAAFAFNVAKLVSVRMDTSVSASRNYKVRLSIDDIQARARVLSTSVTLWGVPRQHNGAGPDNTAGQGTDRTYGGLGGGEERPFLTNATQCTEHTALEVSLDSWQAPGEFGAPLPAPLPEMTGCNVLSFNPAIVVRPETFQAGTPAGYEEEINVPQDEAPEGVATPDVRNVEVAMPSGTVISPSSANGLKACTQTEFSLTSENRGSCPNEAKVGTVTITTPLLHEQLTGNVYVGEPECAPCSAADAQEGKMVRLLVEANAEEAGVLIKLAGRTKINQATGQLTTVFEGNPQQPFSKLQLQLNGGADAPLVNPSRCGPVVATATLTPWSSSTATEVAAPAIPIEGCSTTSRFAPSLKAGMTASANGGSFSGLAVDLAREDGEQTLGSVTVHMPPGLAAAIASVPLCAEPQANEGTCSEASQIGEATAVVGPGSLPYSIPGGRVYLTGSYGGAPFGLSIVTPAQAGPYHLVGLTGNGLAGDGNVVVRASVEVDPETGAVTIASGSLPVALDGIPLELRQEIVNINRKGFIFNATNCEAMKITGTVYSSTGTAANVDYPYQAVNCATLPFAPKFAVTTHAGHTRRNGAYLRVNLTSGTGQANIKSVFVELPKILPSREETLKAACSEAQFTQNPAGCPADSHVGTVTVHTPVLPVPLTGPAIFVSRGGAAFPDLALVLQGDGVTIVQEGVTDIVKRVTSSDFKAVPDLPLSTVELVLPQGPYSALTATGNLCRQTVIRRVRTKHDGRVAYRTRGVRIKRTLDIPDTITGQNGAVIKQITKIAVEGCSKEALGGH